MTRSDLATKLSLRMKISKEEADRYLLSFLNAIVTGLKKDQRVVIQGFGSFHVKHYKARIGKKPISGEPISIPSRSKPVFYAGKELKAIINRTRKAERFVHATPAEMSFFVQARK
ncbi:MAG: HU family DNA-binding protein [Nitrospinales bacterium]